MRRFPLIRVTILLAALIVIGCGSSNVAPQAGPPKEQPQPDEVAIERAKLSAADRALVEAQEWCVISADERLGSMGPPMKLDIKGRPVFICCKGCQRKAEAEPESTLARLEELKAEAARRTPR